MLIISMSIKKRNTNTKSNMFIQVAALIHMILSLSHMITNIMTIITITTMISITMKTSMVYFFIF